MKSPQFEKDYFATNYGNYEAQNPVCKMNYYQHLVNKHLTSSKEVSLLDVGCAFGRFLSCLNPAWNLFGVDVSEYAIEQATKAVPQAQFSVAGLYDLPLRGFDVVTSFDVIEHVDDLEQAQLRIYNALKPNGLFVFVVPVYDGLSGPIIRKLDKDPTHVHTCARSFWLYWVAKRFQILEWNGIYRYLLPNGYYAHFPTSRLRWHTPAIIVVARKR